jgi:hypothetical protein
MVILEGDCMNIDYGKAFAPLEHQLVNFCLAAIGMMAGSLLVGWLVSLALPATVRRTVRGVISTVLFLLGMYYYLTHLTMFIGK